MKDLMNTIRRYDLWMALGWNDVLGRYRRSVLGPFWITISMGITLAAMGPLYGSLFGNKDNNFLLHLSLGMIFWGFISSCINESCNIYNDSSSIIKQSNLPMNIYTLRVFYRQLVILLHNMIILPIVMYFSTPKLSFSMFLFAPAMIITSIFIISFSSMISIFSTRFRDMTPVIQSIMTLLFFVTPIIWSENQIPTNRKYLVSYNLLSNFLDILRAPLMGGTASMKSWAVCLLSTIFFVVASSIVMKKFKYRIAYWL